MEASASRSSRGFDEEDDDDQEFARREGSSFQKDLAIKVDGKGSGTDDLPTTPRSKHSAMEQRRRNKINDRFRMLRELIPHNDQKRDKASLLLEVIEYIRYLQEKVQKYESSYPGSDQENANIMPWVKVYYRSFWKNAQTNNQSPLDGLADPPQVIRNGSAPAFSGQFDEGNIPVGPAMLSNSQNPTESDTTAGITCKMENATGFVSKFAATLVFVAKNLFPYEGNWCCQVTPDIDFIYRYIFSGSVTLVRIIQPC
ncbi:transcription factor BIM2-like [Canna indica]|uniref:Transcription factor BIM2-like n=1 Tax=Canna indica TaxID=4628 RepID=A0AAQ3JSB0_9LILI|nr:transcription factor BIM2-like [Canna indica]